MSRFQHVLWIALVTAGVLAAATQAAEPVISVEPERGIPGQTVVVTGHGFCSVSACSRVQIQLYGAVVAQDVPVSTGGSFVERIRIPGGAPTGEVGLMVTQVQKNGSPLQAFAAFEMAVRLRTEGSAGPKQEQAPPVSRPRSPAEPDSVQEQKPPRDGRLPLPSSPNNGGQAARVDSGTVDDDRDTAFLPTIAAIVLSFGAALALAVVWRRGVRSRAGSNQRRL